MRVAYTSFLTIAAVLLAPVMPAVADDPLFSISNPTKDEQFSPSSNVGGNGGSEFPNYSFTAKIKAGGVTRQSQAGTSSPNNLWTATLNAPSGGYPDGDATFEIWVGSEMDIDQEIEFTDGGPA